MQYSHSDYQRTTRQLMEPYAASSNAGRSAQPPYRPSQPSPPEYNSLSPPEPAPRPPPPPPVHRVYVLNCATCDNFLTDRGMRAVLLLKPHIVLFSTDAAPLNAETSWPDETGDEEHVERTCDCLTSSIACHGCGRAVGYHIVAPCSKCTDSVQRHQRSANHHRFVFHHNEVSSRERFYYPGERGVVNPIIPSAAIPRSREPSPVPPAPISTRRRTSIWDTEKEYVEPLPQPVPYFHSSPPPPRRSPCPSHQSSPRGPLLQIGDTLYWHHLVSGGERSKPVDPRFREPVWIESVGR
ncbi:hypothetical protein JCM10212_005252 [Sporobolomyces blumeae]